VEPNISCWGALRINNGLLVSSPRGFYFSSDVVAAERKSARHVCEHQARSSTRVSAPSSSGARHCACPPAGDAVRCTPKRPEARQKREAAGTWSPLAPPRRSRAGGYRDGDSTGTQPTHGRSNRRPLLRCALTR
jgi:hypothetical protein